MADGGCTVVNNDKMKEIEHCTDVGAASQCGDNFELGSALISGRVTSQGGGIGAVTAADGDHRLSPLPPGHCTLGLGASLPAIGFAPNQFSAELGESNADFAVINYPVSRRIPDFLSNGGSGITVDTDLRTLFAQGGGSDRLALKLNAAGHRHECPCRADHAPNAPHSFD